MNRTTANRIFALICIYFVALGILYAAKTPIFEGPDEAAHFLYIHNIIKDRELPVIPDRETAMAQQIAEVHQQPLYYLSAVPFTIFFERGDISNYLRRNPFASIGMVTGNNEATLLKPQVREGDTHLAVWAVRMYSLFIGTLTLVCVYQVGILVWDESLGLLAALIAASIPVFVHVSASVSNDNLTNLVYSVGVLYTLRTWQCKDITRLDRVMLTAAMVGSFLSKLTVYPLFGVILLTHVIGASLKRYTWRAVGQLALWMLLGYLVFDAWWFVRNIVLYNDVLGGNAALGVWARGAANRPSLFEMQGVWESMWMVLGHLNIPGPFWITPYATIFAATGLLGLIVAFIIKPERRWRVLYLILVWVCVSVTMVIMTQRVNISQGRLMYPGITVLTVGIGFGLRSLMGRRWSLLPVIPMVFVTWYAPFVLLDRAFEPLEIVETLPATATRIDARAESLTMLGYEVQTPIIHEVFFFPVLTKSVEVDLYFQGKHPENPNVFLTAVNSNTGERLGKIDTYPGMSATDWLDEEMIYRTRLRFPLESSVNQSTQIQLALGWRVPDVEDPDAGRYLQWVDAQDREIDAIFLDGPIYVAYVYAVIENFPGVYAAGTLPNMRSTMRQGEGIDFDSRIRFTAYSVETKENNGIEVITFWQTLADNDGDWTLTVALVDENDEIVVQQDAPSTAYPSDVWVNASAFAITRTLTLPDDAPENLFLRVGWYESDTVQRISAVGDNVRNNLYFSPEPVLP